MRKITPIINNKGIKKINNILSSPRGAIQKRSLKFLEYILKRFTDQKKPLFCYVDIPSKTAIKILSKRHYSRILDNLLEHNIIQRQIHNGKLYKKASPREIGKSISYRISPLWVDKYISFGNTTHSIIKKEINSTDSICKKVFKEQSNLTLVKNVENLTLRDLYISAKGKIENKIIKKESKIIYISNNKVFKYPYPSIKYQDILEQAYQTQAAYLYNELSLFQNNQSAVFRNSNKENRLYNKLTNTSKSLYPHILYCGEPLAEVDLKNSQFCIFSNLIYNHLNKLPINIGDVTYKSFIFITKQAKEQYSQDKEFRNQINEFCNFSFNGVLYEELTKKLFEKELKNYQSNSKEYNDKLKALRKHTKISLFEILYGYYSSKKKSKQKFNSKFNHISNIIDDYKQNMELYFENDRDFRIPLVKSLCKDHYTNYARGNTFFPIIQQRVESNIFIDQILPELYAKKLNVIPKHDSFICPESQLAIVLESVEELLENILGENRFKLSNDVYNFPTITQQKAA